MLFNVLFFNFDYLDIFSYVKGHFSAPFIIFTIEFLILFHLIFKSSVYIRDISHLSNVLICFTNIFS